MTHFMNTNSLRSRAPFLALAATVTLTVLASLGHYADGQVQAEQFAQATLSAPTQVVVVTGKRSING
ncbi:MAG TPA: hypothetical protein VLA61_10695 [Ideonella sp.]|uniref:hypothetical protein n=1 Tax=Ideonella sp. TaxID=1929293 RepID=UPI002B8E6616|nr:hypothetical protein [Ideonella sp.]HSI48729.1 hypothetical protein [Ideonella sp.]